jgi:hypothetical protein
MAGVHAPRWVAAVVAAGIGLVALFGLTASDTVVSTDHDCASGTVVCEPSAVLAQPASHAPADAGTQATVPCVHSVGCGGGGALTLIGAGLALLLVAAAMVLLPRSLVWVVRPPKTIRLPQLLLVGDDGRPPRLAAVI